MIHYNQSGRSMTEMLGVLAIMGIITYGAISGINYGMTSYRVNKLYIEVGEIINDIQDMYTTVYGRNNFQDLCCDNTINDYTDCNGKTGSCQGLIKNDILNPNSKGIKIEIADNELTVTVQTKNSDLCDRLKDMDWDSQSITATGTCDAPPYELTFKPK